MADSLKVLVDFYAPEHIGTGFHVVDTAHPIKPGHLGQDIKGHQEGTWIPAIAAGAAISGTLSYLSAELVH